MVRVITTNATFASASTTGIESGFIIPEATYDEINDIATFVTTYMPLPVIDFTLMKIAAQPDLSHIPSDQLTAYEDILTLSSTPPDGCYIFVRGATIAFPQLVDQQEYSITLTFNYALATPANGWGVYSQALTCQLTNIAQIV